MPGPQSPHSMQLKAIEPWEWQLSLKEWSDIVLPSAITGFLASPASRIYKQYQTLTPTQGLLLNSCMFMNVYVSIKRNELKTPVLLFDKSILFLNLEALDRQVTSHYVSGFVVFPSCLPHGCTCHCRFRLGNWARLINPTQKPSRNKTHMGLNSSNVYLSVNKVS